MNVYSIEKNTDVNMYNIYMPTFKITHEKISRAEASRNE